jgi:glutamate synthase domain-containing protein 3
MTSKSLNTRYLKSIRKMTMIGAGLLLATVSLAHWSARATALDRRPAEADNSIPSLQGAAAITYLKEHKFYDSLSAALHAARSQRGDNSILSSLFVDEQKLTASDGTASVFFGNSVAVSGSTLVVGAPFDSVNSFDQGAAYVFTRQGGSWVETQKLTASDGAEPDLFGFSVAISGSTIVVGAQGDNVGNNLTQGSAYVFSRQGGSWVETQKLISSDGAAGDQFGNAVAISGSTIVVNALIDTVNGNFAQGSAYVFNHHGGSWVETQKLTASDGAAGDQFGNSIAVNGSTIVVGAPLHDVAGASDQGSAYVFDRQGGSWVETQELTGSDGAADNQFGWSVAVGGSTIVVGAVNNHFGNTFSRGSAYVYDRRGGSWVESQKLTASDEAINNFFAWAVAISGSTIVATAIFNVPGITNRGAAYVFNRQGGSWVETQKLTASDGAANDRFGWSVAASGPTIVVGAPNDDVGNNINQGSAYVFGP